MQFGTKASTYVAVGIIIVGFAIIFFGWNGAAEKDFVSGQMPYVISGGIAGLAVVFVGLTLASVEARRRDNAKLVAKIDRLLQHLGEDLDDEAHPKVAERMTSFRRSRAKKVS